jgi:putative oxidoreductase
VIETVRRWGDAIVTLRERPELRDISLFCARVGLAWIFVYHGAGTLFGAFNGPGIAAQATFFANTAHIHPGTVFAYMNGIVECFGGAAVGLGIFARIAAFGLVGDMVIAMITVTFKDGIVTSAGGTGYELNLALCCLALVVALQGPGRIALDAVLRHAAARRALAR